MKPHYIITFDGGDKTPGERTLNCYGSFILETADGRQEKHRRDFSKVIGELEVTTSNEAEYMALIEALTALIGKLLVTGADPGRFNLEIRGDSNLVLKQVEGVYKLRARNLRPFRDKAVELKDRFNMVTYTKLNREHVVALLGH